MSKNEISKPAYTKQKIHIAVTILVMAIIFIQSALPGDLSSAESDFISRFFIGLTQLPERVATFIIRKSAHFLEYMILGVCFGVNVRDWMERRVADLSRVKLVMIPWALSTVYAVMDEIHQAFVPGRDCALIDVGIDSAGALIGSMLVLLIWRSARRVK